MGRNNRTPETDSSTQEYWDSILAGEGMPTEPESTRKGLSKAGHQSQSLELLRQRTLVLQERLDAEIVFENQHGSAHPVTRGLPPCIRVRQGRDGS